MDCLPFKPRITTIFSEEECWAVNSPAFKRQSRHFCRSTLQQMANQYLQIATELYRKVFGHNAIRQRYKGRKDAFFEFHVNEDSQADQQTLRRLSSSITMLSNECFKECVQTNYKLFTTEEQTCISECVRNYFRGFEQIAFYTDNNLKQN